MSARLARSRRTARTGLAGGRVPFAVGDLLGSKYRVERILGEGGMGVVLAAHHELLDQPVAVKVLHRDAADREAKERLLLEARAAARLRSEHVARVIDVEVGQDGLPFIVMELLDGTDLCQLADARGPLPPALVVDYVLQALEGLAQAHANGIIHRDLKPSNLFLANRPDGTQVVKILDFGISKSSTDADPRARQLTGGHAVLGSPPYMSPEQVRSPKEIDHRTDIWSIGICMYELLANAMPFGGDELQETFAQILEKDAMPLRHVVPGLPEGLEAVVARCLAKRREARFADLSELAVALAPFGSGASAGFPERIQETLARALLDELSPPRAARSSSRIPLPLTAPGRSDPVTAELHGTARTVARRRAPSRRWIAIAVAASAFVGLGLMALTISRQGGRAAASSPSIEPPVAAFDPPAIVVGPSQVPPAAPTGDVDEPAAPASNAAAAAASSASVASQPRAPGARPASRPATRRGAALPAGLPQTRSGQ